LANLARRIRTGAERLPLLERLFYGAEPMDEVERGWIASALGARPDPISHATEGFLGASCKHGLLHLNEDVLIVEHDPVPGTTRFRPIVTDLRRTSQPMVRVRLDDLLEPIDALCPCGSSRQAVRGVEGRVSDLWRWSAEAVVTPREVADAVSRSTGAACDWRAIGSVAHVRLEVVKEADGAAAASALERVLRRRQVEVPVVLAPFTPQAGPKRRRVTWANG
jgi:phenylacetate-coenzyme A ligase PaaK-like adenylate-forming protein